jgi:hypothetical protein
MADFKFPDAWLPDRGSATNDLGFSTILGGASSLSPRWDYLRTQPQPEDDSYTGGRGIANVEPPPGSPEYREAQAGLAALQAVLPQAKSTTAATALAAAGKSAWSNERFAQIAARLTPLAAAAAPAAVLAVPFVAVPKILVPGDETISLSDDLRARRPIGQQSVIFEQRVDGGLFGTGVGAKWEALPPVDATFGDGMPGRRPVLVDPDQFRDAVGTEAAHRLLATGGVIDRRSAANSDETANRAGTAPGSGNELPPPPISLSSKIEIRIGVSADRGETSITRKATREEVLKVCPNFARYESYAIDADASVKPLDLSAQRHGQVVHKELEVLLNNIQSRLEEQGLYQLRPEIAIHGGVANSYDRGHSKLDVLELHKDYVTVCVYDFKTGRTPPRLETIYRHIREGGLYAAATGRGYKYVYFIPVFVPR